jgi:hypothetical protein
MGACHEHTHAKRHRSSQSSCEVPTSTLAPEHTFQPRRVAAGWLLCVCLQQAAVSVPVAVARDFTCVPPWLSAPQAGTQRVCRDRDSSAASPLLPRSPCRGLAPRCRRACSPPAFSTPPSGDGPPVSRHTQPDPPFLPVAVRPSSQGPPPPMAPSYEDWVKERGGTRVIRKILVANNGRAWPRYTSPPAQTRLAHAASTRKP